MTQRGEVSFLRPHGWAAVLTHICNTIAQIHNLHFLLGEFVVNFNMHSTGMCQAFVS